MQARDEAAYGAHHAWRRDVEEAGASYRDYVEHSDSPWALRQLTSLTALNILGCNIDDVGMLSLSSHPVLTSLNIAFTTVTDEGLRALALLPKLTSLCIAECEVTDMGVAALPPRVKVSYDEW